MNHLKGRAHWIRSQVRHNVFTRPLYAGAQTVLSQGCFWVPFLYSGDGLARIGLAALKLVHKVKQRPQRMEVFAGRTL